MIAPGKLLIVDDELSVRDSLATWFHEEGYEVGAAEDANGALTRMAEQHWDAALVDIKMRSTDGIELQRRMHEIDPGLIVIIMTGYASVETAVAALKNGAYDYVTKPLNPDEIAHLVKKALAHKRADEENVRLRETVADLAVKAVAVPEGGPKSLEEIEKAHILRVLEQCGWNQTRAAELLEIDRVTLHHKMKKYGWSRPVETR